MPSHSSLTWAANTAEPHFGFFRVKICKPLFSFPDDVSFYFMTLTLRKPGLTHLIGI